MLPGTGLYIHVPFCAIKCHYCDFACVAGLDALMEPYVEAVERELAAYADRHDRARRAAGAASADPVLGARLAVASVYLGGGTPSLLPPGLLERLLSRVHEATTVVPGAEITVEANPGTGGPDLWAAARASGVNRVSVGVQVMDDAALRAIGRDHSVEDVRRTMRELRQAGFADVSVDLIYGLPEQTVPHWLTTVEAAIALEPEHFSVYSLQVEDRTVFARRQKDGCLPLPGEDAEREMHDRLDERLNDSGYRRYEISSWCRPGHESVHNRIYWHNRPYIGLGTGAHSYFDGRRYGHGRSVKGYIADPTPPIPPEPQDRAEEMEETIFMGLRLVREGLSRAAFTRRYGADIRALYAAEIDRLVSLGLLEENADCLRLTPGAIPIANEVFRAFIR